MRASKAAPGFRFYSLSRQGVAGGRAPVAWQEVRRNYGSSNRSLKLTHYVEKLHSDEGIHPNDRWGKHSAGVGIGGETTAGADAPASDSKP